MISVPELTVKSLISTEFLDRRQTFVNRCPQLPSSALHRFSTLRPDHCPVRGARMFALQVIAQLVGVSEQLVSKQ